MNPETDIVAEYFSKLPVVVQDAVRSEDWKKRVGEITAKYSLDKKQSASLQYEILFVVVGMEPEEALAKNIETEIGVSSLLAEQLSKDIEDRLLSWIDKLYSSSKPSKENRVVEQKNKPQIPEIRPNNLPTQTGLPTVPKPPMNTGGQNRMNMNRPVSQVQTRPENRTQIPPVKAPTPPYKPVSQFKNEVLSRQSVASPPEPVQRPISVPRFIGTPIKEVVETQVNNIMENKLKNVTTGIAPTTPQSTPPKTPTVPEPVKRYTVDPYREPAE